MMSSTPKTSVDSPSSFDIDSVIEDVSFEYNLDDYGNIIRTSKGSSKSNHSTPPTPVEPDDKRTLFLDSPTPRRASLSRSESAYPVMNGPPTATSERDRNPARSFHRVASGPIPTTATTAPADAPPIRFPSYPRRLVTDQARRKRTTDELSAKLQPLSDYEEKENIASSGEDVPTSISPGAGPSRALRAVYGSRPLGEVQRNATRAKATKAMHQFGRISEAETEEESDAGHDLYSSAHPPSSTADDTDTDDPDVLPVRPRLQATASVGALPLSSSQNNRPRRSASLSDALYFEEENARPAPPPPRTTTSKPGTSLGLRREVPVIPPRRSSPEEEDDSEVPPTEHVRRRSSSPQDSLNPSHKRRDSDTLRSALPYPSSSNLANAVVDPPRRSPTMAERAVPRRLSPSTKNLVSSSSRTTTQDQPEPLKHRRSPTAPEPGTGSDALRGEQGGLGKTWAAGDRDSGSAHDVSVAGQMSRGDVRHPSREYKERRDSGGLDPSVAAGQVAPQQQQPVNRERSSRSQQQAAQRHPSMALSLGMQRNLLVNKKAYAKLDLLGKGGSSKVYRVMTGNNEIYACKRVQLEKVDSDTMNGYMNEISLLKRLDGNKNIIRLIDSEVRSGQGGGKGSLALVMECGEIDLARLMAERACQPLDMVWVAYYWQQMLQAVQVIHDEKIVHSDLKPANFVLVKGQLKLIDFGIANAIANDTTNIQRDHQIGTLNYMSPEAIELPDGMRRLKVGRASDVWSLGCILYQMIYGRPPFFHFQPLQKMKAIPDPSYVIEYPEYAIPLSPKSSSSSPLQTTPPQKMDHLKVKVREDVIDTMKACLSRHPKERITIPDLLKEGWLNMKEKPKGAPQEDVDILSLMGSDETMINPYYMRQLLQYGIMLGQKSVREPDTCMSLDPDSLMKEGERLVKELKKLQLEERKKERS